MKPRMQALAAVLVGSCAAAAAHAGDAGAVIDRAEASAKSGSPSVEPDLDRLLGALRASRDIMDRTRLINAVCSLGDADGSSPAAVKAYLRAKAPDVLLELARGPAAAVERGQALLCLRTLRVSDAVLDQGIAIADADPTANQGFVHNAGMLLREWKQSRSAGTGGQAEGPKPPDAGAEQPALAFLRAHRYGVSDDDLQRAIGAHDVAVVEALLSAGVSLGAGSANGVVINGLSLACSDPQAAAEPIVQVIDVLAGHGLALDHADTRGNTILMTAAQLCPAPVAARLVDAGAKVDPVNLQGFTPLKMALVSGHWATAGVLVDRGARLTEQDAAQIFFQAPEDPAQRDLLARAIHGGAPAPARGDVAATPRATPPDAVAPLAAKTPDQSLDGLDQEILAGHPAVVERLVHAGVDVNGKGSLPQSPLELAAMTCAEGPAAQAPWVTVRIMNALIAAGADPNAPNGTGLGPLMLAAQHCKPPVIKRLLAAGARLDSRTPQGFKPLSMALIVSNYPAAEALIDAGARLSAESAGKLTEAASGNRRLAELVARATKAE